jgi:two-component SAPR family response regulator
MNHPLKIVIVEDEPAAASQLQFLLGQLETPVDVIHIIEGVEEGLVWFQQNTMPDLILSDIQLSDGVSFEIYEKITLETPIIFTTAFDEYAIRAFKLNSIDYLLKPIDQEALTTAIQKFKNQQLYHYSQLQSLLAQQAFMVKLSTKFFSEI